MDPFAASWPAAGPPLWPTSVADAWGTGGEASDLVLAAASVLGALAVGRAVRVMGFETDLLEARTSQLERERDEQAQAAVAEERARIARELHDVIGHSISVMGVQAGAVRRLLAPEQAREREALLAVERVGRDAVEEMHRLLGFLRSNGERVTPGTPLTLQRVDDLVAEMRRAGLEVDLHVDGQLDDLSAGRALAAFRILQEALTNVLRHAPGARVSASLRRTAAELQIEVADDGGARPGTRPGGGGHGLVGMRERAALYGGTLEAGPRADARLHGRRAPTGRRWLMAIRVLIADDQAMVRAGFRMILDVEPDMEVVGEAADGEQALVVARHTRPDLVVMDIRMPVLDGVAATRRLLAEVDPPPHVLMVTTFGDDESLYSALRAGAGGFLLKNAPPEQLVDAARNVAAGEGLLSPAVTRRVIEELARTSPPPQSTLAGRAGRTDGARARGAAPDGARPLERRDRRHARHHGRHRQDTCRADPHEARPARPRPGCRARLRNGVGPASQPLATGGSARWRL